jgi:hypothetical protein
MKERIFQGLKHTTIRDKKIANKGDLFSVTLKGQTKWFRINKVERRTFGGEIIKGTCLELWKSEGFKDTEEMINFFFNTYGDIDESDVFFVYYFEPAEDPHKGNTTLSAESENVKKLREWHRNKGTPISQKQQKEIQEKAVKKVEQSLNKLLSQEVKHD